MPQKRTSKASRQSRSKTETAAREARGGGTVSRAGIPPERLEYYARLLQEERRRLRQELSEMERHQGTTEEKPVADVSGAEEDLVDVATEAFEREKGLALESSVQGLLHMVEDALRRIHDGTYGICDGCGRPIDANRLRAIPYARLCIRCKEKEERARSAVR